MLLSVIRPRYDARVQLVIQKLRILILSTHSKAYATLCAPCSLPCHVAAVGRDLLWHIVHTHIFPFNRRSKGAFDLWSE
jgi:hypothetical protein